MQSSSVTRTGREKNRSSQYTIPIISCSRLIESHVLWTICGSPAKVVWSLSVIVSTRRIRSTSFFDTVSAPSASELKSDRSDRSDRPDGGSSISESSIARRVGEAAESSSMRLEEVFSKAANSTDPSVSRGLPMRKEESLETMDLAPACSARFDLVRRKRRTARTAFFALLTWVFVRCSMLVRWCWVVACFFRRRSK